MGWTLNVGGAIVRNLRGIDDFTNGGFYWDKNTPWDTDSGDMKPIRNEDSLQDYLLYLEGTRDAEPDIFYFNCGNMSGNMFFGKN